MKIIYIANVRLPTEKAHGLQIMKMCEAWGKKNMVVLVAPFRFNHIRSNPFEFYSICNNFSIKIIFAIDLLPLGKILGRAAFWIENLSFSINAALKYCFEKTDCIFSRDFWSAYFLSLLGKRVAYEIHDSPNRYFITRHAFGKIHKFIVTNVYKANELVDVFGVPREKILVAPNGVDMDFFNIPENKEECRRILQLPQDKKIVLYTGHLYSWKGADILKDALLKLDNENILGIFVGGTAEDIVKFKTSIGKNILCVGHQEYKKIPYFLRAADILILPNTAKEKIALYETSPIKLFEYIASGVPVIASNIPSVREIVAEKEVIFFTPDDSDDLKNKIKEVLTGYENFLPLTYAAKNLAEKYSWTSRAQKIEDFLMPAAHKSIKKTILITISRGGTARNILQSDTFKILKSSGHKIVILTPAYKDERFLKEFSAPGVYFENLVEPEWTLADRMLVGLHKALIYNHSVELWDKYGYTEEPSFARYAFKKAIFLPLSRIRFLRRAIRWLDKKIVKDRYYHEVFDKYKPDMVFSTSVMEDADVFVLKQAQARKIATIGMAKSWDNTSKMSFRVKTEKLIAWSQYVKDESMRFQCYKDNEVVICGIPQFDFYFQKNFIMDRDDFFDSIGADKNKKLIFFGSEGKVSPADGEVVAIMSKMISDKKIKCAAQIFARPHFAYLDDEKKFDCVKGNKDVIIDDVYDRSMVFRDHWDYSIKQIKRLANLLYHSDMVVTSASTLVLDAASLDKPIVSVNFDGFKERPFNDSIRKWYFSEYMRAIVKQEGDWIVNNEDDLVCAINSYFENPGIKSAGRERLRNYFCHKLDGASGKRIAEALLAFLG